MGLKSLCLELHRSIYVQGRIVSSQPKNCRMQLDITLHYPVIVCSNDQVISYTLAAFGNAGFSEAFNILFAM